MTENTTQTTTQTPTPTPAPAPVQTTDSDKVANLRAELAAERVSKDALSRQLAAAKAELEGTPQKIEAAINASKTEYAGKLTKLQTRLLESEVKTEAVKLGLKDLDLLPLLDRTAIKLDDDGNITGVAEAFTAWKAAKPDWFAEPGQQTTQPPAQQKTTGNPAPAPAPANANATRDAVKKMSPEEYRAFKTAELRKLRR